jgi:hypothetical protein
MQGFQVKCAFSLFPTNNNCMDLKLETYEPKICLYTQLMSSKRDISCGPKNPLASNVWNHLQCLLVISQSRGKIICVAVSLNGHNFKSFIVLIRHKLSVLFQWSFKTVVKNVSFILYIVLYDTGEWGIPLLKFWWHFFYDAYFAKVLLMNTQHKHFWHMLTTCSASQHLTGWLSYIPILIKRSNYQ